MTSFNDVKIDRFYITITMQQEDGIVSVQEKMLLFRRIQLSVGSALLLFMIVRIIYKKLYVYNTTKMFMWCCICYFVGMAIVLLFNNQITNWFKYVYKEGNPPLITDVLQSMKANNNLTYCGLYSFINLYFYDLGYFFAVMVTYNVFCVLQNNYRRFMKNVITNPVILVFLIFMLVSYALPFILIYTHEDFQQYYSYSYGPTGFKYGGNNQNLLLFCGISFNPSFQYVAILNIYICPIIMFIVHCIMLIKNRSKINAFAQDQYLNSKQQFIIRSGKISFVVFLIQLINCLKLFLSLIIQQQYFIIVINYMFDLYPLALAWFYVKYTKQKQGISHGSSTLIEQYQ